MTEKHIKGININYLNTFMTTLTAIVFCFIMIISANVNARFRAVKQAINKFILCEQSSKIIKESANYLTETARLFVVSHDTLYAEDYLKEITTTRRRETAMESLKSVCNEQDLALQRLEIAMKQADDLMQMELYAIRLTYEVIGGTQSLPEQIATIEISEKDKGSKDKMQKVATETIFGQGYLIYKDRINDNCDITVSSIEQQIQEEMNLNAKKLGSSIGNLQVFFFVLLMVNVLIFIAYGRLVLSPLKKFSVSIKKDEKLEVIGSVEFKNLAESYNEIYDQKVQNEKSLLKKAEYDALTGILNRHAFEEICTTSSQKKQKVALLLVDLDNFKYINDTYGHAGGDTVLKEVARLLVDTFRKGDYVCRIGGDEFAVILPDFEPPFSTLIREKINHINDLLCDMKDDIKPVSISVGAALSNKGYSDQLYKDADSALYKVKEQGKRGCEIFNEKNTMKQEEIVAKNEDNFQ